LRFENRSVSRLEANFERTKAELGRDWWSGKCQTEARQKISEQKKSTGGVYRRKKRAVSYLSPNFLTRAHEKTSSSQQIPQELARLILLLPHRADKAP